MAPCPSCGADRGHLLGCEHGTISFAPTAPLELEAEPALDTRRARAWAVPVALGAMGLLALTGPGAFLVRVFFGMWLHELGHALASWLCGVVAVPLPWVTLGGQARSPLFGLLLFGALGALGWKQRRLVPLCAGLAVLLGLGWLLPFRHATTFIVFAGDGGALVLGTALLVGAVWLPDDARLSRGGLRWGYLVIGAGAFMDAFVTWVRAWRDFAELPFGRSESSGASDALRLVDVSGWSEAGLVRSYLALAIACLAVLAAATISRLVTRRLD